MILTDKAKLFVDEWFGPADYIEAHTSGSTGTPKAIRLSKSDMRLSARATNRFFNITPHTTLLLPLSPDYIAGKMQIVRALEAGCGLTVEEPSSRPFATYVGPWPVMVAIVPAQIEGLLQSPVTQHPHTVIIGGSPLTPAQEKLLTDKGVNAWVTYGMTETCSHVAVRRVGENRYSAMPGISFDTDGRGCLVVSSEGMSFGRLVTNDIVKLHSHSQFEWLGRADNVIISGGVKLHPEQMERIILPLLPLGVNAYVSSRPSEKWGCEAVLVTDAGADALPDSFLDCLNGLMPYPPKAVVRVEKLAYTASGKIIRE